MSKYATYLSYTSEVPKSLDRNIKIKWSSQYKWDFFCFCFMLVLLFLHDFNWEGGPVHASESSFSDFPDPFVIKSKASGR